MRKFVVAIVGVFIFGFSSMAQRPDLPGHLIFDFGLNSWSNTPVGASMDLWKSKDLNITYLYDLPIGDGGLTFTPGVGLSMEKFAFDNNTTLTSTISNSGARTINVTQLETIYLNAKSFKRTKLSTNYVDVPLEFRWYARPGNYGQGFRVALGGKVGILYSSYTKVKMEDEARDPKMVKDRQELGVNPFRYGILARIGWGGIGFFGYYELSKKFDNPPPGGENTKTFSFGISLTGF
jgi:hypothetical protein